MTVYVENETEILYPFEIEQQLKWLVDGVCRAVCFPYEAEVSLTLVDKERIHSLNKEFRQVDRWTDVLSFPMMEYDTPADFEGVSFVQSMTVSPETQEVMLGDIVLCSEVVYEQAKQYGHSVEREFSFLVVHSLLHLFGYDHIEEEEREEMETKQREIMEQLQINR